VQENLFEQVLVETLEQFTFQFADVRDRPDAVELSDEMFWLARLIFHSEKRRGYLQICMPVSLSREITVSVMGALGDGEVTEELVADAMKECSNIIAGSFTAARFGVEEVFAIDHPEASQCVPESVMGLFDVCDEVVYLQVDDYILLGGYGLEA
jgi:hypothetical protein